MTFSPDTAEIIQIDAQDSWPAVSHRFDQESIWALQTAISIGRPLLLRGEPGIGKSQLARAAAHVLRVPFLYHVVDERSERDDLLHHFDAVARLAEAQVCAIAAGEAQGAGWREALHERHFLRPGVLWWAFDWVSAELQAKAYHERLQRKWKPPIVPKKWTPTAPSNLTGPVVLIDEIDKADPSVPNGLLECLGNDGFHTDQLGESVALPVEARPPLVIITTNEERELPSAFLRRCLVLHMQFPKEPNKALAFLTHRGEGLRQKLGLSEKICQEVAECILADRAEARGRSALPGASEFLELLRALAAHAKTEAEQSARLKQIKTFVLSKHDALA
jgi:MoxR-like ATPase